MKVSIFGAAGTVGSCTAFAIVTRGLADELVLLDTRRNVLMNHVMDMDIASRFRNDAMVIAGNDEDISGSDVVIIAVSIPSSPNQPGLSEDSGADPREREKNLMATRIPIIKEIAGKISKYCPEAVVITASNPTDTLNYIAYLTTSMDRKKFLGYNLNDSIRFRTSTAQALGIKPSRIEAFVAGIHPETQVFLSQSLKVDGKTFSMDSAMKKKVQDETGTYLKTFIAWQGGRTAGWTTASGIAEIVDAIAADSQKVMAVSVILDGEYGYRDFSLGLPAVVVKKGIYRVEELKLSPEDRAELDSVARIMESRAAMIREITGLSRR
jgi:malate dehydrogenase